MLKLSSSSCVLPSQLLWDRRMETFHRLWIKGREGPQQQIKNIELAPCSMPPLWPCHLPSPGGKTFSVSQEKEWQDEPPSASLQWRPLSLFPGSGLRLFRLMTMMSFWLFRLSASVFVDVVLCDVRSNLMLRLTYLN